VKKENGPFTFERMTGPYTN